MSAKKTQLQIRRPGKPGDRDGLKQPEPKESKVRRTGKPGESKPKIIQ